MNTIKPLQEVCKTEVTAPLQTSAFYFSGLNFFLEYFLLFLLLAMQSNFESAFSFVFAYNGSVIIPEGFKAEKLAHRLKAY